MSTTEDQARAAMRAIAVTVSDAPPLRLDPAADELLSPARGRRRARGGPGRQRRWRSWAAPLTAAAVVVALAISLVLVRDIPNDGAVSPNPTTSTGPGGAPRYYAALAQFSGDVLHNTEQNGIVVGDSLTGKRVAKFAPPAHTTFQSVMAAADDRTFVVFALTSSTGSFLPLTGVTLTASWYMMSLAPGSAKPVRLTKLPIKPWSWVGQAESYNAPAPGQIWAMALSQSGQELAVADTPDIPAAATKPQDWQEVKVFSVATGRLLHDWTENDPNARLATVVGGSSAGVPVGASALTWIDGDQALTLATSRESSSGTATGTVRRLDVTGPATGNLKTDSTVLWSGELTWNDGYGCYAVSTWPPVVSADGKTVTCMNYDELKSGTSRWMASFVTDPLPPGTGASIKPRFDYQVKSPLDQNGKPLAGGADTSLLWVSPSGDTLIAEWHYIENRPPATGVHVGVISHGKFTPLRLPSSLANAQLGEIAW
jgi:hypothetical protein